MKIVVTLDAKNYSQKILKDVARLAENTLADIVFLGVQEAGQQPSASLEKALLKYQRDLYSYFTPDDSPYAELTESQWQESQSGEWIMSSRGLKEFSLRIRTGSVAEQTIALAEEVQSDLIVLGCGRKFGCEWDGEMNVPLRIARAASCSVLVIKQVGKVSQIVSILDQSVIRQDSLEMVNQLVTLNDAGLKIVGVREKRGKHDKIEKQMVDLLKYYNERQINAWLKLLESDDVKEYVRTSSREGIVALWMGGKESLLKKLFSRSMVDKLLEDTRSSLMILR